MVSGLQRQKKKPLRGASYTCGGFGFLGRGGFGGGASVEEVASAVGVSSGPTRTASSFTPV